MNTNLHLVSYAPHLYLIPFIEYYWIARTKEDQIINRMVNVLPITMHNLIFFIGDNAYKVNQGSNECSMMPQVCMIGIITQNDQYLLKGNVHFIAVRFKPSGLSRFFNLSPSNFVSRSLDFVLYEKEIQCLYEGIAEMNNTESIINCLNEYFLKKLPKYEKKDGKIKGVNYCIETIYKQNGNVTISNLYNQLGLSERGFRKLFINSVGISPKQFSRIHRFNYVFSKMILQKSADIYDIIERVGYFDQSHFLKEFKSFTGYSLKKFKPNFLEFDELHRKENNY